MKHTVLKNDTLAAIARHYYTKGEVSWVWIWRFNPHITDPHQLIPGTVIEVGDPTRTFYEHTKKMPRILWPKEKAWP